MDNKVQIKQKPQKKSNPEMDAIVQKAILENKKEEQTKQEVIEEKTEKKITVHNIEYQEKPLWKKPKFFVALFMVLSLVVGFVGGLFMQNNLYNNLHNNNSELKQELEDKSGVNAQNLNKYKTAQAQLKAKQGEIEQLTSEKASLSAELEIYKKDLLAKLEELRKVEKNCADLIDSIDGKEQTLTSKLSQIAQLNTQITQLEQEILECNNEIKNLNTQIVGLNKQIGEINGQIAAIEEENKKINANINTLKEYYNQLQATEETLSQEIVDLEEENKRYKLQIDTGNSQLDNLLELISEKENELQAKIQNLNSLKEAKTGIDKQIAVLTAQLAEKESLILELSNSKTKIEQNLEEKSFMLEELEKTKEFLEEQLGRAQNDISELSQKHNELLAEISELEILSGSKQSEIDGLTETISSINTTITNLENDITSREEQVAKLNGDISELNATLQGLKDYAKELEFILALNPTDLSYFTIADGSITAYVGPTDIEEIVIPETYSLDENDNVIDGTDYYITKVNMKDFSNLSQLKRINIGNQTTTLTGDVNFTQWDSMVIGPKLLECKSSFLYSKINNVYISNLTNWLNVKFSNLYTPLTVAENIYMNCEKITTLNVPQGTTKINDYAFAYVKSITQINLPEGLISIGNSAFAYCGITQINFPSTLQKIDTCAFAGCMELEGEIVLNEGLSYLGAGVFSTGIISLSYTLPKGVTKVTSIVIPTTLNEVAHAGMTGSIIYGRSNVEVKISSIEKWTAILFHNYSGGQIANPLEEPGAKLVLNGSVVTDLDFTNCPDASIIKSYVFYGYRYLKSVNLSGITEVMTSAFEKCKNLETVIIDETVSKIYSDAFIGCSKLCDVYNKSSCTVERGINIYTDPANAGQFFTNNGVRYYKYSKGCYAVGAAQDAIEIVFANIEGINSVSILSSFAEDNETIKKVTFVSNKITEIPNYAFANCSALVEVNIVSSVQKIGVSAFEDCKSLQKLKISQSVTNVGGSSVHVTSGFTLIIDSTDIYINFSYTWFTGDLFINNAPEEVYVLKTIVDYESSTLLDDETKYIRSDGEGEYANYYKFVKVVV